MITSNPIRRIADIVASNPAKLAAVLEQLLPRRRGKVMALANLPRPEIERVLARLQREAFQRDYAHCQTVMLQYRGPVPVEQAGFVFDEWLVGDLGEGKHPTPGEQFELTCPDCGEVIKRFEELRAV